MKSKQNNSLNKALVNLILEAGLLKRTRRSGWSVVGVSEAESVADHSFRCAVIGFILARTEKVAIDKVLLMTLFNDIHEARITDLHKMAQRYIEIEKVEDKAFDEQMNGLAKNIKNELLLLRREYRQQLTPASIVARDADILECLIQAKEYKDLGFKNASKFMKKAPVFLKTKSARKLWQSVKKMNSNNWWLRLSDFKR